MKFVLDTHVWIWSIDAPERLAPEIRRIVEDGQHELLLSSITYWETSLLIDGKRISGVSSAGTWIDFALLEYHVTEVPVDRRIALESRAIDLATQDPADRFIAATARLHAATLLTHDRALLDAPQVPTLSIGHSG